MRRVFAVFAAATVALGAAASAAMISGCSSGDTGSSSAYKKPGASSTPAPWNPGAPPASTSSNNSNNNNNNTTGGNSDAGANSTTNPPPATDSGTPASNDSGPTTTSADTGTAATQDSAPPPPAGFDQFQVHNLNVVNMYRATLNVAPLVLDQTLSTFALAGSTELTMDHTPHQHFINASNDNSIWMDGFTNSAAENQGDPNGWTVLSMDPTTNEMDGIDAIQLAMFNEGPGAGEAHGHYTNMMNAQYMRLGVGLLEVNGALYLTNDFSN
jgi:uncharacterized protein YkwD